MDKITKEHLEILANIGKKKDIQAFIVKNYFKMLDLNNIIKEDSYIICEKENCQINVHFKRDFDTLDLRDH